MKKNKFYYFLAALSLISLLAFSFSCSGDDDDDNDATDDDDNNDATDDDDNNDAVDDDDDNDVASDNDDNDAADDDDNDDNDAADDDDVDVMGDSIVFEMEGEIFSRDDEEVEPGEGWVKVRWGEEIYATHDMYVIQDVENESVYIETGKGISGSVIKMMMFRFPNWEIGMSGEFQFDPDNGRIAGLAHVVYRATATSYEIVSQELQAICKKGGRYKVLKGNFEVGKKISLEGECTLVEPTEEYAEWFTEQFFAPEE